MTPVAFYPASTQVQRMAVGVPVSSFLLSKQFSKCSNGVQVHNACHTLSELGTSNIAEILNTKHERFYGNTQIGCVCNGVIAIKKK